MKGVGELGQNHSLCPQTNHQRKSSVLANKGMAIAVLGSRVLRYGLVLVVGWIGLVKFTGYEANGIQPLVAHSPLMEIGRASCRERGKSWGQRVRVNRNTRHDDDGSADG